MKKFYFLTLALICAFAANAADLYIFGSFNGWDPKNSTKMTYANNVYTAEIEFSGDCNFALATVQSSDWDNVVNKNRYGTAADNQVLVAGEATNLSKNANAIKVPYAAKWTITVSADFKTVTATTDVAETYPEKVYMVGHDNGWNPANPLEIAGENGVYTAQVVFTNTGFKLSTAKGTWDGDFNPNGLNVGTVTVGTPATISTGWSNDNSIAIGTYDITIDLVNKTFLATTPDPTAIEEVGVDAGAAVYYNLQGVKVANPENGIFIKKQGNRTSKVVL